YRNCSSLHYCFRCRFFADRHERYSFPTRRSSDLGPWGLQACPAYFPRRVSCSCPASCGLGRRPPGAKSQDNGDDSHSEYSGHQRSEEHTSELQSRENLVCRLLLEKKKIKYISRNH